MVVRGILGIRIKNDIKNEKSGVVGTTPTTPKPRGKDSRKKKKKIFANFLCTR